MRELLAPAGSMEALKAAIANGCDAVYLGMQKFGARAYSSNFDEETIAEAVTFAHLRDVKVYVTVNTIAYQDELPEIRKQLEYLNSLGVDGIIAQDLAVLEYVARRFADMEAHCSTQMGIDDVEGALLAKQFGARRVVVAREAEVERVRQIRREADIPVEVFIHGALCVSYSGNCIMSGMTGNRLGNRGRCIGSCRKLYDVIDVTAKTSLGQSYVLSTKDLNTIDHIEELEGIDSLKIEGRMKEPAYVANVVSRYRLALDGHASAADKELLNRTFNRTYTKGYLMHEDRRDITNIEKPNNYGYEIGEVAGRVRGMYKIALSRPLRQNDVIRIRHDGDDVNLSTAKIYDDAGRLVNGADKVCFLKLREKLSVGDIVYKTKDVAYAKELESRLTGEYRRFPLDFTVHAYPGAPLIVDASGLGQSCSFVGEEPLSEARSAPPTRDLVAHQLDRLNDTIFELGKVELDSDKAFIPAKMLNAARKSVVEQLYAKKLASWPRRLREETLQGPEPEVLQAPNEGKGVLRQPRLVARVATQEQYDACCAAGLETVYFRNVVPRNGNVYSEREGLLLVGGLGGIEHYRTTNPFVSDYSLNVVNAETVHLLQQLGACRVTLSYEINERQLDELCATYQAKYNERPHLEMIVYGHAPLLVTKYCPLKKLGQCGTCRDHRFELREEYGTFPLISHENCDTTVLNGKVLNLLDELGCIVQAGVETVRLDFTIESFDEVTRVVDLAKRKLALACALAMQSCDEPSVASSSERDEAIRAFDQEKHQSLSAKDAASEDRPAFNPKTDTRGHFNKEIM